MPVFGRTWAQHRWAFPEGARYYLVDTLEFGGFDACVWGSFDEPPGNKPRYGNTGSNKNISWSVFNGRRSKSLELGPKTFKAFGCAEDAAWQEICDNQRDWKSIWMGPGDIFVYANFAPCLSCCASLWSIAKDLKIRIAFHFTRDTKFFPAADRESAGWIFFPRSEDLANVDPGVLRSLTSKPTVFVFHQIAGLVHTGHQFCGHVTPETDTPWKRKGQKQQRFTLTKEDELGEQANGSSTAKARGRRGRR